MELKGKAMEMMIRTAISALGIDAESLLTNIQQFQQWVSNAIQHHDGRLVALEKSNTELHGKIDELLALARAQSAEIYHAPSNYPVSIANEFSVETDELATGAH